MTGHAQRITAQAAQNQRMAEMERCTVPLFWLVYAIAAAVCIAVILTQPIQGD